MKLQFCFLNGGYLLSGPYVLNIGLLISATANPFLRSFWLLILRLQSPLLHSRGCERNENEQKTTGTFQETLSFDHPPRHLLDLFFVVVVLFKFLLFIACQLFIFLLFKSHIENCVVFFIEDVAEERPASTLWLKSDISLVLINDKKLQSKSKITLLKKEKIVIFITSSLLSMLHCPCHCLQNCWTDSTIASFWTGEVVR